MARAAKKASKTSSKASKSSAGKARGGAKTASRSPAKKGGAKAANKAAGSRSGAAKRGATKTTRRQQGGQTESWFGALNTLMASGPGREIIADVLEAAAGALRRQRENMTQAMETGAERVTEATGAAANVATEMALGTVELAQTAASVLADVVTDAARTVLPSGDDDEERRGGRSGGSV